MSEIRVQYDEKNWKPVSHAFMDVETAAAHGLATPIGRAILESIATRLDFRAIAKILLFSGVNQNEPGIIYLSGEAWREEDVHYLNLETNKRITALGMGELIAPLKTRNAFIEI
jgi:hypothetical protein